MKYSMVLGLAGLTSTVMAHPKPRAQPHNGGSVLSKRGVDLSKYTLPSYSSYTKSSVVKSSKSGAASVTGSDYLEVARNLAKEVAPGAEFRVVEDHYVSGNGVAHVNLKQTVHGIDIDNADLNVNVKDGKVFSYGSSFFDGELPKASPLQKRDYASPVDALKGAIDVLGLPLQASSAVTAQEKKQAPGATEHVTLKGTAGAVSNPEARLVYFNAGKDGLKLTWRVETDVLDNWLLTYVNADDTTQVHGVVDYVSDLATYEVYPWNINDPTEGDRKVVEDPWVTESSYYTWQSDGATNYTVTRGNNAAAQNNPSGGDSWEDNYRPDAGEKLAFEYPFSLEETDTDAYIDASVAQLFYTSNRYHDLLYLLGFDEAAGNFQADNNGKGGAGGDFAILNAQDGSGTNNANFATPPDGGNGRMRMYLWDTAQPERDCSFEAGVVIHEFTHGLSNRLTGGPANAGCLPGGESGGMGEGWSDFFATAVRLKPDDTSSTDYAMGAWVANDPKGIREHLYSTSTDTNPFTFSSIDEYIDQGVHALGNIWATFLYELLWKLIETHGKNDSDLPNLDSNGVPDDGKFLAMKLVLDGLALQPCNPDFIAARDGIVDADKALTDGANACDIWTAFAKRGLGANAKNSGTHTDDFELPEGVC
ncbi:hypothetical protein N3K66_008648 [Trichothecium roseum]|uniref:Uncharacterized protein n=1 Tax=Trichothecium roseum TaxID=47278 RepID=A0ACC0US43_9HYPO|nr:hypothetical protein N3K66_008648 [Trichothecium roseum]